MKLSPRVLFWLVPVVVTGLFWVAATGQPPEAEDPPAAKKPMSIEDEVRELKRRADSAEREFQQQKKENKRLHKQLKDTADQLTDETKAREEAIKAPVKRLNSSIAEVARVSPPVGTVIMWWGDRESVPPGWELCDGGEVQTSDAALSGKKPDFTDRFPKGAVIGRQRITDLVENGKGGSNNMPALKITTLTGLDMDEQGEHNHHLSLRENNGDTGRKGAEVTNHGTFWTDEAEKDRAMKKAGKHKHTLSGYVGKNDGINADGGDKTGAKQPAYQEVFFLIRVK